MTIWIDNRTEDKVFEDYETVIQNVITECLNEECYPLNVELSVSIVNNEEIKSINSEFRHIHNPTDVLSFPMLDFTSGEGLEKLFSENINVDTNEIILGDIIISIERAKQQAEEYGHSLKREVCFLTAHSMFHLMGYDHMQQDEEIVMKNKQNAVLDILNITRE